MESGNEWSKDFKAGLTERLVAVIRTIESSEGWDSAKSENEVFLYQLKAAHNVGVFEPFTAEQTSLSLYLQNRLAGRKTCDYAWRMLVESS